MDRESRRDYWRCVLDLQSSSGLSIKSFCDQEKIPYGSFFVWRRRLREVPSESSAASSGTIGFAPVTVVSSSPTPTPAAASSSSASAGIEIVLSGDRRVVLRGSVDRQALSDVLAVLGVCVCGGGAGGVGAC